MKKSSSSPDHVAHDHAHWPGVLQKPPCAYAFKPNIIAIALCNAASFAAEVDSGGIAGTETGLIRVPVTIPIIRRFTMRAICAPQSGPDPYRAVRSAYYPGHGAVRPMQSYSSYQAAPATIDIGSVITMMLPLVMIGMMSKLMVSGKGKNGEGKENGKDKAKDKDKQGRPS